MRGIEKYVSLYSITHTKKKIMNATATEKANKAFQQFSSNPRFKTEVFKSLAQVNEQLRKELKYKKDLRNVEYLSVKFESRAYFKILADKFNPYLSK